MTKQYPPQAERVPLSASASRYQRRNMATGSKNRRHSRKPQRDYPGQSAPIPWQASRYVV